MESFANAISSQMKTVCKYREIMNSLTEVPYYLKEAIDRAYEEETFRLNRGNNND